MIFGSRKVKSFLVLCSFLLANSAVQAAQAYDFSYNPHNGPIISGSFTGDASGNLITNLANVSVDFGGVALFSGVVTVDVPFSGSPSASFDGLANNFIFMDNKGSWFSLESAYNSSQVRIMPGNTIIDYHAYSASNWQVTAVPEPETCALLIAGLGLIGGLARRREAGQA